VQRNSLELTLVFTICGLFFYSIVLIAPILNATIYGRSRASTLINGPLTLDDQGFWLLASFVLLTTVVMPLIRLGGMLVVLIGVHLRRPPWWTGLLFGWLKNLRPWAMTEIFLLGLLVAYTRLHAMMRITPEDAAGALIGLMLTLVAVDATLDIEAVWEKLKKPSTIDKNPTSVIRRLIGCDVCHQVSHARQADMCSRCDAPLQERKPDSLVRTWALVITASIFYVPSNIYPVMSIAQFGHIHSYTILGGIQELARMGLWPVAILVFTASIAIPLFKLASLGFLLVQIQRKSSTYLVGQTRLYRLIEFIGRWSMLDVFVVSILVGLINFGPDNKITAENGIVFFAAVVVSTLFAVESFDPRLMWDMAFHKLQARFIHD